MKNKKLKVETDEQNLAVQKRIIEELGSAWGVSLIGGSLVHYGLDDGTHAVCVFRKHYRHFLIDSFGNLIFCDKEVFIKSHNEEITFEELII